MKFKKTVNTSIAILLQISLFMSNSFAAPETGPSPHPSPADVTNWQDTCKHIKTKEEMLKTYASDSCLQREKCKADAMAIVSSNFGQIGPQCKAAELTGKGKAMEITSVAVFGAATAVCLAACATKWLGDAGHTACEGASIGATAVDLGMTIGLTIEKKKFHDWYKNKDGKTWAGMQWGGTAAGGIASGVSTLSNTKDINLLGLKIKGSDTLTKEAKESGKSTKDQKGKSGSCFAAVLLGATTAIKGLSMKSAKKVEDGVKENIKKLGGDMLANLEKLDQKYTSNVSAGGFSGLAALENSKTPATPEMGDNSMAGVGNDLLDGNNPQVHAALANTPGMEDFLKRLGPNGESKKALDKLGFNPEKFAQKVASGMPASAAMSEMMPSLPKEAIKEISDLENIASKGDLSMNGVSGTYAATKFTAAPNSSAPEIKELSFGDEKADGAENLTPSLDFDAPAGRVPAAVDPADIWHSSYPGTIFDIVSQRISKAQP